MITLYNYLRESIFDDEEDVLDNSISRAINNELKELDQLFAAKWGSSPLYSRLVNDTLLLLDTNYKGIDPKIYDKIKDIKDISGFTTINTKGLIVFDIPVIDSSLGDEIICSRMRFCKNVNMVKDVQLTFDHKMDWYGYILQSESDISFQNVEFKYNIRDIDTSESTICFCGVPTFKNCYNSNGLNRICIYKRDILKHHWIVKKINDFLLDDKHITTYRDGKIADKYHKRKGDLKTVLTTIKMQKKYIFDSSENGKLFKIKPNAKLKDVFDVDGFKDLNIILIEDVAVGAKILFQRKLTKQDSAELPYCVKFPNDDWYMAIVKINK